MKILLLIAILMQGLVAVSQTANIFVHSNFVGFPEQNQISTDYTAIGFNTVNITSGAVNATLTTANYNIAYITEFYSFNNNAYSPEFLTAAQRVIVQNFIAAGGHVVWIAESWDVYPNNNAAAPANTNAINTINNLFGTNLAYGNFYNNGGMGGPDLPRIHPSNGPGALAQQNPILSSGSYATLINVPTCSKVYTSDSFDNTNTFMPCTSTTVALFPSKPQSTDGSIIIATELAIPFHGIQSNTPIFPPPPPTYNSVFDSNIAQLHFNLITNANMASINNWSDIPANINSNCGLPVANFSASSQTICEGNSITFTNNSTGALLNSWNWDFASGTPTSVKSVGPHTVQFNTPGVYDITLMVSDGSCTDDKTIQITVTSGVNIQAGNDLTICEGEEVTLTASNPKNANISWDNDVVNGESFQPTETKIYTVTANLNGCTSSDQVLVSVTKFNKIEIIASQTDLSVDDQLVHFSTSEGNNGSINNYWDFGDGNASQEDNPSHTFQSKNSNQFVVTLESSHSSGCVSRDEIIISIRSELLYYIPNCFTPNNDGSNNVFKPVFTSGFDIYDYNFKVFNRNGELIFESYNSAVGWDGNYSGNNKTIDGVYVWRVEFADESLKNRYIEFGTITIVR